MSERDDAARSSPTQLPRSQAMRRRMRRYLRASGFGKVSSGSTRGRSARELDARRVLACALGREHVLEPILEVDRRLEVARAAADRRVDRLLEEETGHVLRRCTSRVASKAALSSEGRKERRAHLTLAAGGLLCSGRARLGTRSRAPAGRTLHKAARMLDSISVCTFCEKRKRGTRRRTLSSNSHRSASSSFIHSSGSSLHLSRSSWPSGSRRVMRSSANCCTKPGGMARPDEPSQSPRSDLRRRRAWTTRRVG